MLRTWIRIATLKLQLLQAKSDLKRNEVQKDLVAEGISLRANDLFVKQMIAVARLEAEIALIRTNRLVTKAMRLGIDPPEKDRYSTWQVLYPQGMRDFLVLSMLGESKLRRQILIERRLRAEFWLKLIPPIITALTGVLGTLIGVLAILRTTKP